MQIHSVTPNACGLKAGLRTAHFFVSERRNAILCGFRSLEKWEEPFQLGLFRPPPVFANLERLGVFHLSRGLVAVPFLQHASEAIRDADIARGVAVADLLAALGSPLGV